ncbi:Uncharacterised protein [Serratia ficaria]|uniref:hypothetical protein n=1 Tax=Serratia ficaria TaxID=61651 RepID=UPI002182BF63|nr:hypothetical protein [Serratia ficaria]CAI2504765.1 Uncharacterised protein [Serratia ficaria]
MTITTEWLKERLKNPRSGTEFELITEVLANREAVPVALVDRRQAARGGICWQSVGKDLPHGTELFTTPPAPAATGELLKAMEEVIRISDRDHDAWARAKAAITACRAAMPAEIEPDSIDKFVAQVCGDLTTSNKQ